MQRMDGLSPGRRRLINLLRVSAWLRNINEVGLGLKAVGGIMDGSARFPGRWEFLRYNPSPFANEYCDTETII